MTEHYVAALIPKGTFKGKGGVILRHCHGESRPFVSQRGHKYPGSNPTAFRSGSLNKTPECSPGASHFLHCEKKLSIYLKADSLRPAAAAAAGSAGSMSVVKLEECRQHIRAQLDGVVEFWLKYSHDTVHGGFFTCIGRDGNVYDELKYVWLQGRQVWMYCRLYRSMDRFRRPEILEAAKAGGAFLRKFARVSVSGNQWKCAFCLTRDGKAVKVQRTIFSECFYIMAMDELSRVTGDKEMQMEAEQMMEQLIYCVREDSSGLGRPQLLGDVPINSMAVPMMLLCLVQQVSEGRLEMGRKYAELGSWCVSQIQQHIQKKLDSPLRTAWALKTNYWKGAGLAPTLKEYCPGREPLGGGWDTYKSSAEILNFGVFSCEGKCRLYATPGCKREGFDCYTLNSSGILLVSGWTLGRVPSVDSVALMGYYNIGLGNDGKSSLPDLNPSGPSGEERGSAVN
ncbi:hypothetical protein CHARACLAT_015838 [Characodon lateralis]|uniref:N-acylglucosamine 2-epimerase n=1 Tax=Characodon lateralis TaxID=208331 RepID=A0ABU7F4Q2_9TELE|nr:hypothetical protein [Characodon lateralis]